MTHAPDWEDFGRAIMQYGWPTNDIDGSELFDLCLMYGLIRPIEGGFNPDEHIDAEGICPDAGDPWYEYAYPHNRADLRATDAQVKAALTALVDDEDVGNWSQYKWDKARAALETMKE